MCCYVVWMGEGHIQVLVGKLEGKNYLEVLGIDGRIILNGSARNGLSWTGMILLWMETCVRLL